MLKKWLAGIKHRPAFVLVNGIVAAALIFLAIIWLGLCEQQLKSQREKMRTTLRVVRLAKEATDQVVVTGRVSRLVDGRLTAEASSRRVVVRNGLEKVYEAVR